MQDNDHVNDDQIALFGFAGENSNHGISPKHTNTPPRSNQPSAGYRTGTVNRNSRAKAGADTRKSYSRHQAAASTESTLLKALVGYHWASRTLSLKAIHSGQVAVNGKIVCESNEIVNSKDDVISVRGNVLVRKSVKPVTLVFHKPKGIPGSKEDGTRTLYSYITNRRSWFTPCGVLPATAGGIVVVSNDKRYRLPGNIIGKLSHDLHVKVQGTVNREQLSSIPSARIEIVNARATWLSFEHVNMNLHVIAKALKPLGLEVLAWERTRVGPFTTTKLSPGAWYQLTDQENIALEYMVEHSIVETTPLDEIWLTIEDKIGNTLSE